MRIFSVSVTKNFEQMDISVVQKAFFPSTEISDPDFFVGRTDEIKDAILAIPEAGAFLAIHGLRGVGKSSVAKQIQIIAEGDMTLPSILKISKFISIKDFNFLTLYTSCDTFTRSVGDVVKRIIIGDDKSGGLIGFIKSGERQAELLKEKFKAASSSSLLGTKLEGRGQDEIPYKTVLSDDLIQQFKQLLRTVQKDNQDKSGLLIIIDEFDILKDKDGFGSLIKTTSSEFVKYVICGIANTVTELIESHTSIGRQLRSIKVNKMPKEEMYNILKRAEHHISNNIYFTEEAAHEIIESAEGFPFFVHLLGKEAFLIAFGHGLQIISKDHILSIKENISKGKLKTIYEEIYHSAVKESPQRELLLKLFAEESNDEIFSEPVYASAKDLGVTNPSQLMRELTIPQDDSLGVLTKIREQYYRFTDPVFKVYARLRTWKFGS
jgi:Cdc6-like AAA superfamily ATPase